MAKVRPLEIEKQLDGLRKAVAHSERLYRQGIFSLEELEGARTYALRERMGPLMSTEEYIAARQNGDFEKYEALMNDGRTPSASAGEQAMRKAAAHFVADTHLNTQYATAADQEKYAKIFHDQVKTFIDTSGFGEDADSALVEANIRMNLGEKVEKPVEVPSWSLPVQKLSDDDTAVKNFRLRDENTPGTRRNAEAYGNDGVKRAADGRIISKTTLREDADKPKPKKSEYDDTRGFTVDHEYGVQSASDAAEIERFEQSQRNDTAAAAEATPAPAAEQPVTLPNPSEA